MTLAKRMAAVRVEAFGIGKQTIKMTSKDGKGWEIKSHTVEAILSEIRPLLDRHRVGLIPLLREYHFAGNLCTAMFDFEFMDLETGEVRLVPWAGSGTDNSDKALAKAGTNALKEMLKKVFLITDRDDAREEDEKVEHKTAEGIKREQVEQDRQKAARTRENWAKAFKANVEAATTEKDVDRLYREASEELAELPGVTRGFFDALKASRKAALASAGAAGAEAPSE